MHSKLTNFRYPKIRPTLHIFFLFNIIRYMHGLLFFILFLHRRSIHKLLYLHSINLHVMIFFLYLGIKVKYKILNM